MMNQTRIYNVADITPLEIEQLARALEKGAVAALSTDTVYGLATGAYCEASIQRIYQLKNRPAAAPLQLLAGNMAQVQQIARFSAGAKQLAQRFWPGALTMVLPPTAKGQLLTRGFAGLGVRVPGNLFLQHLLDRMTAVLASTSANLHGQPVVTEEKILLDTFNGKVDYIVLGGTLSPVASSVVDLTGRPRLLREEAVSRADLERVLAQPLD